MSFLNRLATELKTVFAKINHNHDSAYEVKNSNIQAHVTSTTNPHATTSSQIGLGNVTNDKQIKANVTSVVGKIPIWNSTTGDLLGDGYTVDVTLTSSTSSVPTSGAVNTALNNMAAGLGGGTKPGVADIATLKAINTTNSSDYPDKLMILVENTGLYRLDRESVAVNDNNFTIAPTTGSGRWIKISGSVTDHNLQSNIQGGLTDEKYHISLNYYNSIPSDASASNMIVVANNTKLSKLSATGTLNVDNIDVTEGQWTAFQNLMI